MKIVLLCLCALTFLVTWVSAYLVLGIMDAYAQLDAYPFLMGLGLLIMAAVTLRVLTYLIANAIQELRSDNERQ